MQLILWPLESCILGILGTFDLKFWKGPPAPPRISWWISIKKNSYFQISLAKLCETASFSRCDLEAAVTVKFYLSMFQTSIWAHILCGWLFLRLGFGENVFEAEVEAKVRPLEVARGRFWPRSNLTSWDLGKSFEYHLWGSLRSEAAPRSLEAAHNY